MGSLTFKAPSPASHADFETPNRAVAEATGVMPIISRTVDYSTPRGIYPNDCSLNKPPVPKATLVPGLLHSPFALAKVQYNLPSIWVRFCVAIWDSSNHFAAITQPFGHNSVFLV
jgi:hypothetical protein